MQSSRQTFLFALATSAVLAVVTDASQGQSDLLVGNPDGDDFGWSLAALGDLDGDGVTDLAVGAHYDDDDGSNRGAVWVLFLDGVPDNTDDEPTQPGVSTGFLEDTSRDLGTMDVPQLDLSTFNGSNDNANQGRRNSLANRATDAANFIAVGDIQEAIDSLTGLLGKIDGETPPPDWMDESTQKSDLANVVTVLIALLELELL